MANGTMRSIRTKCPISGKLFTRGALVGTHNGLVRFRLANHRLRAKVMNKFQINIPAASQPNNMALVTRWPVHLKLRAQGVN